MNDCWNKIGVRGDGSCPELPRHVHCRNCPVYSAAAARLLDAQAPEGYLAEWTRHIRAEERTSDAGTHSAVIFRVGAEWLALATAALVEIAPARRPHSLPHRRGALLGVANIRGQLLACVSLATLLGIEADPSGRRGPSNAGQPRLLVVCRSDFVVAVPADEVHGILRFHPRELRDAPATDAKAPSPHVRAMLPWRDRTVGWLDEERLLASLERSLA